MTASASCSRARGSPRLAAHSSLRRGLQATLLMRLDLLVAMFGRKASGARIRDHQGRALRALDRLDDRLA